MRSFPTNKVATACNHTQHSKARAPISVTAKRDCCEAKKRREIERGEGNLVRLDLKHLEQQTHEVSGTAIATVHATQVLELDGLVDDALRVRVEVRAVGGHLAAAKPKIFCVWVAKSFGVFREGVKQLGVQTPIFEHFSQK